MNEMITVAQARPEIQRKFMTGVYIYMVLALAISAAIAVFTYNSNTMRNLLFSNGEILFYALLVAEFLVVVVFSAMLRNMSVAAASGVFFLYSVLNGLTLSTVFLRYTDVSIFKVFIISAGMFGGMSIYGAFTKTDLTSKGRILYMALFGLVIASLVNMLFRSPFMDWLLSIAGVAIFTGLTAYDTQRILLISIYDDGSDNFKKFAVIGALELYLDFINIFLHLLSLFGKRRR